jgi:anti-anti-sigma regulatory factor
MGFSIPFLEEQSAIMKLTMLPLQKDDVIRIRTEGQIGQREVEDPLLALLGPNGFTHRVLLKLDRASGINTSGLCWLVESQKRFDHAGGKLVLTGVPPVVLDVLDFLRLTPMLHIAADEQEACKMLAEPTRASIAEEYSFGPANRLTR